MAGRWLFMLVTSLSVGALLLAACAAPEKAAAPIEGAPEIKVVAREFSFGPAEIRVKAGEPVNVVYVNEGAEFHDFVITGLDFRLNADPGVEVVGGLAVEEPGTYEFICSVDDHKDQGMVGTLVVE